MNLIEELTKSLASALRYIEVQTAYNGAMTATEVEKQILANRNISVTEIAANSCTTLAWLQSSQSA